MQKRIVNLNVLPGEPLDGTGKVCIHLFVQDEKGPFVESYVLQVRESAGNGADQPAGKSITAGPARGRLACDPKRLVAPVERGNVTTATPRSDDPRAVTCVKCRASKDYVDLMAKLEGK